MSTSGELRRRAQAAEQQAANLRRRADEIDERERMRRNENIPVDRDARTLTDGRPVTDDHREIGPDGMQKAYVVLSAEERAKGFVRPVRRSYVHVGACGGPTTMGQALAETYARDPSFYSGTFCAHCRAHFPVGEDGEFVWQGTNEKVGT